MFELDASIPAAKQCPICGQIGDRKFRKNHIWIRDCANCNHRFTELELGIDEVGQIYDGQYFQGDGLGYLDYLAEANLLRKKGQFYGKLLEGYCWPGTALDVGAAAGFILHGLMDYDWQSRGIEPNARIGRLGREKLRLNITPDTLETFPKSECYDLVMMIQVLSHFYDLEAALEVADRVTRPGGLWLIETWNRNSWTARLRGKRWRAYQPPTTQNWFSPCSLREIAEAYDFEEVGRGNATRWVNAPYLRSLLRYHCGLWSYPLDKLLAIIPDSWTMPWPVTDRFWAIYQKAENLD
ncbi:MAG: methyltransferase domain-containing protein [Cyanobacteria bacterium P01_A01_bin.17]